MLTLAYYNLVYNRVCYMFICKTIMFIPVIQNFGSLNLKFRELGNLETLELKVQGTSEPRIFGTHSRVSHRISVIWLSQILCTLRNTRLFGNYLFQMESGDK